MNDSRLWVDEKKASEITGRAVQTLRNDRNKCKGFPYHKIGSKVLYKLTDIETFMDQHRIVPENMA